MILKTLKRVDSVRCPHWLSGTTTQRMKTSIACNKLLSRRRYCCVVVSTHSSMSAYRSAPYHFLHNSNIIFFSAVTGNIPPAAVTGNPGDSGTEIPFLLADIGEGIKEVELLQWFVNVGDHVHQFDKVCEVQSDKATVEITSRFDGYISKLHGQPGDMMQVGHPLLFLKTSTIANTATITPTADAPAIQTLENQNLSPTASHYLQDAMTMDESEERLQIPTVASRFHLESDESTDATNANATVLTSPAVRKLAREFCLDLTTIVGTGPQGRILKADVVSYLRQNGRWNESDAEEDRYHGTNSIQRTEPMATTSTNVTGSISSDMDDDDQIVQLKGYNRMMLKSMTASLETPHMCFGDEILVDKLLELRRDLNHQYQQEDAISESKISTLAIFTKALDVALSDFPMVNSIVHNVEQCEYKIRKSHNIGIAMDTPRGLVVPVIRNCQTLSIIQIQQELDRLKELAESGKFPESDLTDVTFTISNIGSIGGTYMQPVLAPPALAMAALGRIRVVPRFAGNNKDSREVYPASVLSVTLAADHRFLDGATLARFARAFQRYVESPALMLSRLK